MSLATRVLLIESALCKLARNVGQAENVLGELEGYNASPEAALELEAAVDAGAELERANAEIHALRNELAAARAASSPALDPGSSAEAAGDNPDYVAAAGGASGP